MNWRTASEQNNWGFEIEKLNDPRSWDKEKIAFVEGQGTTNEMKEYLYHDLNPSVGINYYRLKQLDFAGTYVYSKVIAVDFSNERALQVYPNPVNDQLQIAGIEKGEIVILDATGKTVFQTIYKGTALDVSDLPKGLYFVKVSAENGVWIKRLIKE